MSKNSKGRGGHPPSFILLSLGTNLGDRLLNLKRAIIHVKRIMRVERVSSIYLSKPAFNTNQPGFYNMCLSGYTGLSPYDLLSYVKNVEFMLNRRTHYRYKPRSIDIDILLYDDLVIDLPYLKIPHPGLVERDFFIVPALEIHPNLIHPSLNRHLREFTPFVLTALKRLNLHIDMEA